MFVMCLPRLVIASVGWIKLSGWGFISFSITISKLTICYVKLNIYYYQPSSSMAAPNQNYTPQSTPHQTPPTNPSVWLLVYKSPSY